MNTANLPISSAYLRPVSLRTHPVLLLKYFTEVILITKAKHFRNIFNFHICVICQHGSCFFNFDPIVITDRSIAIIHLEQAADIRCLNIKMSRHFLKGKILIHIYLHILHQFPGHFNRRPGSFISWLFHIIAVF